MVNRSFPWEFSELPLVVMPGIEAAVINGMAEVEYTHGGDWQIKSVCVEGFRNLTMAERAKGIKPWVYIPASAALEHVILGRLDNEWRSKVSDAVAAQIEIDREAAADDAADYRREARREMA